MELFTQHSPLWLAGLAAALLVTGFVAGIMAGLLVYLSDRWSAWLSPASPLLDQVLALGALVAVAMPVYFGIAFLITAVVLYWYSGSLIARPAAGMKWVPSSSI